MAYFRKRANGWEYRISYKVGNGKYKQVSKSGFKTKSLAQLAANKAELELAKGFSVDKEITLCDYFKKWYKIHKKPRISIGTSKHYETAQKAIAKYFKETKIINLKPSEYQAIINEMGTHYQKSTLKLIHTKLKTCLKYAVADGIIAVNPAELITINSTKETTNPKEKFLEIKEYQKLIEETKTEPFKYRNLQLYLLAVTGMRYGESLGLTWDDIDFKNGIIDINKTWNTYTNNGFAPTKNKQSIRKIPIDNDTIKLLVQYKQLTDNDRLFTSSASAYLNKRIKHIVGRSVHIHSLRHTYVSYLLHNGIEVITISKLIGHKDVTITLNTYSHLLQEKEDTDYQKIKKLFNFGADLGRNL